MATDNNSQGWSIWEAIGGLRANVQRLIEGQQRSEERLDRGLKETNERIDQGLKENNDRLERGLKETNRRIDRVTYTIIGFGTGILGTIIGLIIMLATRD